MHISSRTDPYKHLRFHRTMRDAYGYDAGLTRTKPVQGWGKAVLPVVVAVLVLLFLAARL